MADIVQLHPTTKPEAPGVWTCSGCGSQTFYLFEDGTTACALCGFIGSGANESGGWLENLRPDPNMDPEIMPRARTDHGSADLARAAVLRDGRDPGAVAVVIIWPSGRLRVWLGLGGKAQGSEHGWFKDTLTAAADLAFGVRHDTGPAPETPE